MNIEQILTVLNERGIRATYGAVGQALGIPAIAVSRQLGGRRPSASWVVSSNSGRPTGYSQDECHEDLFSNPRIIRSADHLATLMAGTQLVSTTPEPGVARLMGIDLAWISSRNGSGLALGSLSGKVLTVEQIWTGIVGLDRVRRLIETTKGLDGVAIDAPLIITNSTGSRICEKELSAVYGSRWAGCYPSNLDRFPNAASVELANWLSSRGHQHLENPGNGKWQIECYPHPAIIEIFGLSKRLRYKKGKVAEKRRGQIQLSRLIKTLYDSVDLSLVIDKDIEHILDESRIRQLVGQALKDNEDGLDAIICLFTAAMYAINFPMHCFGDVKSGYIVVPNGTTM